MAAIDDLINSTTALLNAVNVKKATLDEKVGAATGQAMLAAAQANASAANAGIAGEHVISANEAKEASASSAAQAAQLRDQTFDAFLRATYPIESLGGIAANIHYGPVVRAHLYDTSKDSDGGLWRERTSHTSWYNEPINGKWLGQRANEAAARAVEGATTGSYYQNTTDGKHYALNATYGQTEVFRGNKRKFPARALLIAESARVVIYDLDQPDYPIAFVFPTGANKMLQGSIRSVAAINGVIYVATDSGLFKIDLISDTAVLHSTAADVKFKGNISVRNAANGYA